MLSERTTAILSWMELKGINQKQLADISGLSRKTIYRLTRPDYTGLADSYDKIAEALGITLPQLFEGPEGGEI